MTKEQEQQLREEYSKQFAFIGPMVAFSGYEKTNNKIADYWIAKINKALEDRDKEIVEMVDRELDSAGVSERYRNILLALKGKLSTLSPHRE